MHSRDDSNINLRNEIALLGITSTHINPISCSITPQNFIRQVHLAFQKVCDMATKTTGKKKLSEKAGGYLRAIPTSFLFRPMPYPRNDDVCSDTTRDQRTNRFRAQNPLDIDYSNLGGRNNRSLSDFERRQTAV